MKMGLGILTVGFLVACSKSTAPAESTTTQQTTTKESTTMETKTTTQTSGTIPTASSNIVSVEYPVAHDGIQLYGKITAPSDYKETSNCDYVSWIPFELRELYFLCRELSQTRIRGL